MQGIFLMAIKEYKSGALYKKSVKGKLRRVWVAAVCMCLLFPSCYIIREAPVNEPFIVAYQLKNKAPNANIKEAILINSLKHQNNLFIQQKNYLGIKVLKAPPVFDSMKMLLSIEDMQHTLARNGYFFSRIEYSTRIKRVKINKKRQSADNMQTRVFVDFLANLGKPYYISSFVYHLNDTSFKGILKQQILPSVQIRKQEPFAVEKVNQEISRIVSAAHNVGMMNLTEKHFDFLLDTLPSPPQASDTVLVSSSSLKLKKNKHYLRVHIFLNPLARSDSAQVFKQFFLRNLYFLPDVSPLDSIENRAFQPYQRIFIDSGNRFIRPLVLDRLNTIQPRSIFSQVDYNFTIKKFINTNIWSVVNLRPKDRKDTLIGNKHYEIFDLHAFLNRQKRFNVNGELGVSFNTTPRTILFTLPNRTLATSVKTSFTAKNVMRLGLETQVVFRAGVETIVNLAPKISVLLSEYSVDVLNHVPWLAPFDFYKRGKASIKETYFNLSAGLTDRSAFYKLKYASFVYAWRVNLPDLRWDISLQPIQTSLTFLTRRPAFIAEEAVNASLAFAFNQGVVAGLAFSTSKAINYRNNARHSSVLRLNVEESGLSWGRVIQALHQPVYRYLRTEFSFIHYLKLYKSTLAYRAIAGVGINFNPRELTLPFFKQFFAGGPNSMRGWNATRLGLGSSPLINFLQFKDRYGDIRLETNLEYRFDIFTLGLVNIEGACFMDIGNIWNRKLLPQEYPGSVFSFKTLLQDVAVAAGTGLRVGISFLILRLDAALRLKDPVYPRKQQWVHPDNLDFRNIQLQIGLGYPF